MTATVDPQIAAVMKQDCARTQGPLRSKKFFLFCGRFGHRERVFAGLTQLDAIAPLHSGRYGD